MDYQLDEDFATNDVQYFFSLHGPRFEYMNKSMAKTLSNRYGMEFRPIRILNAWPSKHYNSPNFIVLNKRAYKLAKELGKPVVFLPDCEDVNLEFSQDSFISELAKKLHKKQDTVFVYPFTTAFLDLPTSTYTVLGPNAELAKSLDNKINQIKLFKKLGLPCNNARIYESESDLLEHEYDVVPSYISAAYTSGGNESGLIFSPEMLRGFLAKLRVINKKNSFLVSDIFEDIVLAPNVNALVTSDGNVFTLVLSDQILEGNRYLGNIYPSAVSKTNKDKIYSITDKIGKYLASQGYRGLFGCDFLINKNDELVVVDLNPRHQGGYVCNGLALQTKGISLTDLELSVLQDDDVQISQQDLDEYVGFAWSHSKIVPSEKGQVIKKEFHQCSIEDPFSAVSHSFITGFYRKNSIFVDGYIGYQVQTANTREELEEQALRQRENFDTKVFGL